MTQLSKRDGSGFGGGRRLRREGEEDEARQYNAEGNIRRILIRTAVHTVGCVKKKRVEGWENEISKVIFFPSAQRESMLWRH